MLCTGSPHRRSWRVTHDTASGAVLPRAIAIFAASEPQPMAVQRSSNGNAGKRFSRSQSEPSGRAISTDGHIKMMGAVQPFISGAISKTVNMPQDSTVGDIEDAYIDAWRLGVKALAIYRDGSKRAQVLSTKKDDVKAESTNGTIPDPVRRRLPVTRASVTHKFSIQGHEGYITAGLYEDGSPGEIWLTMAKEGSTVSGLMDTIATMTSIALQYGVPLKALVDKFSHTRFEPAGFTNNASIPIAKSVKDYVFRYLGKRSPAG